MCGVAGIVNFDGRPVDPADVRIITRALAHRGPDGEGVYVDDTIGLGHRRLAVLELGAGGAQPMSCIDGRYYVTYNGEIYNFIELRDQLQRLGHRFATGSDTEVIAHAYQEWGRDCVLRFNGMWAFALYDVAKREVLLSRDRFGIKPLFYFVDGRRLVFASELKAFLHLPGSRIEADDDVVRRTLLNGYTAEATEDTLLAGVKRLRSGHDLLVTREGVAAPRRWWSTLEHLPAVPRGYRKQTEEFTELFRDSCRLRMRSDVAVGTCLSGGMDSTSVLCTMHDLGTAGQLGDRIAPDWHQAFVASFPDTAWDERSYAAQAVAWTGASAHYIPITMRDVEAELSRYAYDFEAVGGSLAMPLWLTYRELRRQGVYVSLDGHGADEMLGGYASHLRQMLRKEGDFLRHPLRTVDIANTLHHVLDPEGPEPSPGHLRLLARSDPRLRGAVGSLLGRQGNAAHATAAHPWVREGSAESPPYLSADEEAAMSQMGALNGQLYREFHHTVLPIILRNFDRCSMAHGVEIRMPFMDWRLVTYTFALPERSKVGGGYTKRILRDSMAGRMPEPLRRRRKKIGFTSPLSAWFNAGFDRVVWERVQRPEFLGSAAWNGPQIRDFVATKLGSGRWDATTSEDLWRFVQADFWLEAVREPNRRPRAEAAVDAARPAAAG